MTKSKALKLARGSYSRIFKCSSTDYVFYGPYRSRTVEDLSGPDTECRRSSYWAARKTRSECILSCALNLLGVDQERHAEVLYKLMDRGGRIEDILKEAKV